MTKPRSESAKPFILFHHEHGLPWERREGRMSRESFNENREACAEASSISIITEIPGLLLHWEWIRDGYEVVYIHESLVMVDA